MGGIGRSIAGMLAETAGSAYVMTAAWLEFEIRVPGEQARRIRRALFDLIGPAARTSKSRQRLKLTESQRLERCLSLMRSTEILLMAGAVAPQFVIHLASDATLRNADVLRQSIRGEIRNDPSVLSELAGRVAPMPSALYPIAIARFASAEAADVYIDRPNILTRHLFPVSTGKEISIRDATDIVANEVGVGLRAKDAMLTRMRQGVRDTNAEALVPPNRRVSGSVAEAFAASRKWVVLASSSDPELKRLRVPPDVHQRIIEDIESGYLVVASADAVKLRGEDFIGWWRIDPRAGNTLGIGTTGMGQTLTERAVLTGWVAAIAWSFEYLICKGLFVVPQSAKPASGGDVSLGEKALDWLVPSAYAQDGGVCAIDALVAAAIALGIEVVGVTWGLVLRTVAGTGYSGILSGRPILQSGDFPGEPAPILAGKPGPTPEPCPSGGGVRVASQSEPAVDPLGKTAVDPLAKTQNAGEPTEPVVEPVAKPQPNDVDPSPELPPSSGSESASEAAVEPSDFYSPGHEYAPMSPEEADGMISGARQAQQKAHDEFDQALVEYREAAQRSEAVKNGTDDERFLANRAEDIAAKRLQRLQNRIEREEWAEKHWKRVAKANDEFIDATNEKAAADRQFNNELREGATFDGPEYNRWKEITERFEAARRAYADALRGKYPSSPASSLPVGGQGAQSGGPGTVEMPGRPPVPGPGPTLPLGNSPTNPACGAAPSPAAAATAGMAGATQALSK
jgi:hypothetical protein